MTGRDDEGCRVIKEGRTLLSSSLCLSSATDAAGTWMSRLVSLFFTRLACGDDLPPLIRHIRSELQQPPREAQNTQAPSHALMNSPAVQMACAPLPFLPSPERQEIGMGVKASCDIINDHDQLLLHRVAKVALIFSVESDRAQDEATRLLYEPAVVRAMQRAPKDGTSASILPLPKQYDMLLSNRVAVSYARRWAREGRWDEGLQLLKHSTPTLMTTAAAAELFSHAGRWDKALHCLGQIPPSSWTEIEVSATVRSLYRAAQRHRLKTKTAGDLPTPGWWKIGVHILAAARDNEVQLSAPSAVNNVLGLLAADGQQWVMACRIVEGMLLRQQKEGLRDESNGAIRPNMVSIYHMCRALRHRWCAALHYASLMIHEGDIRIVNDFETTDRLLKSCISGHRWAEALYTIKQSLDPNLSTNEEEHKGCVNTETFLNVLQMLHESQKGYLATQLLQQPQLSKHFSEHTIGRAYNAMLRYCNNTTESMMWLRIMKAKSISVENESYEYLMILNAREGDWKTALSSFHALLTDPRRRHLYIPSAKAHDAVQYALERAPPPGPSWKVALTLFAHMCDLHVPISEVAFQSVVKTCFAKGKTEEAQSLFQFVVRHGVHR